MLKPYQTTRGRAKDTWKAAYIDIQNNLITRGTLLSCDIVVRSLAITVFFFLLFFFLLFLLAGSAMTQVGVLAHPHPSSPVLGVSLFTSCMMSPIHLLSDYLSTSHFHLHLHRLFHRISFTHLQNVSIPAQPGSPRVQFHVSTIKSLIVSTALSISSRCLVKTLCQFSQFNPTPFLLEQPSCL